MRHYKEVKFPEKVEKIEYKKTCDLCGSEIKHERFSAEEVSVYHETGTSYPEGGSGVKISVDMCAECFDEKLIPWLNKQGCNPTNTEWDW